MTSSPLYPQYLADGGMWKEGMEEGSFAVLELEWLSCFLMWLVGHRLPLCSLLIALESHNSSEKKHDPLFGNNYII